MRIEALYAGLNRTCIPVGAALGSSWLFAAFSYYLSEETGADWFTRSGSVMCLIGAIAAFRLVGVARNALATALREGLASVPREIELALEPPKSVKVLSYLCYLTGIVGTAIWGYGDLLPALVSTLRGV